MNITQKAATFVYLLVDLGIVKLENSEQFHEHIRDEWVSRLCLTNPELFYWCDNVAYIKDEVNL